MSILKVLGAYATREGNRGTSTYQVTDTIVIDAGNIMRGCDAAKIDHILLTHCHMEHIADIPFLIDAFFAQRKTPLNIYGLAHTLQKFQQHMFNGDIWPDFTKIPLIGQSVGSVALHEIMPNKILHIGGVKFKPILTTHTVPTVGFVIEADGSCIYLAGDTYKCKAIWDEINSNRAIKALVLECTYPTAMSELARTHGHLTPTMLREELIKLKRTDLNIYIAHLNPMMAGSIIYELSNHPLTVNMTVLDDGDAITY
ncbi:cAMP phosphodiesterase class-II:metallo-beta-lactamase superfamily protein [Campylobacterota bacterium]|nr:cAMP phosphodiesterase class-II:metallo-beta-lactamase superfamily protein [Campylobacterota bacterium]